MDSNRRRFAEEFARVFRTSFDYAASVAGLCQADEILDAVNDFESGQADRVIDLVSRVRNREACAKFARAMEQANAEADSHFATLRKRKTV